MYDRPYTCENALPFALSGNKCIYSDADDELTTSETVTFETMVATEATFEGAEFITIYGGITWGYSYSSMDADTPEPPTWAMMLSGSPPSPWSAAEALRRRARWS